MNLNRLFNYLYGVIFLLVLVVGVLSFIMLKNHEEQTGCEKKRIESFELAREIEESTTSLSRYCRLFVVTGDTVWRNSYYELLEMLRGERPGPNGKKFAVIDSLRKLGITENESAKIEDAKIKFRQKVFKTEERAMNAMLGLLADENGNYSINGEPDQEMAEDVILDEEYLLTKAIIHQYVKDFELMIDNRTTEDYEHHRRISMYLLWSITLSIALILIIMTFAFVIMKNRLIKRNDELEEAYKHLEDSEGRYRALFENSPDGYLTIVDGKFTTYNKSAKKMMNADDTCLLGKTPDDISPEFQPDGRKSMEVGREKIGETLEYGMSTFEWVHTRCDGKEIYVEISLSGIMLDDKPALLATWRDITERKQIERELQENEKRLRIAQAIGNMGSWELELDTWKFIGSRQAGKIYGIDTPDYHELPQSVAFDTPLPEYREMVFEAFSKFVKEEGEYNIEFQLKRFDNDKVVWVHSKAELDYDQVGKPYKATGIIQDINDRKIAEETLKKNEMRLRELIATKDKFFSIISHDLKGPFNALLHLSQILVEEYDEISEQERKSFLKSIDDIAVSSYKLMENLLEWARLQTGTMSYKPEKLKLQEELQSSIKLLEKTAKNKNINLSNDINPSYEITADKYMLDTIIRNLVSNAIKFTREEGRIVLSVSRSDKHYKFTVSDNGIGMGSEAQHKLFRIENSFSTEGTASEKGTGLGLIFCKEMVEMHGGKIWVESKEGEGTTFTFIIPAAYERSAVMVS